MGDLGLLKKVEVSVVAIDNYVMQRLLRPYHDWLMSILLPTDGTFDQTNHLITFLT